MDENVTWQKKPTSEEMREIANACPDPWGMRKELAIISGEYKPKWWEWWIRWRMWRGARLKKKLEDSLIKVFQRVFDLSYEEAKREYEKEIHRIMKLQNKTLFGIGDDDRWTRMRRGRSR